LREDITKTMKTPGGGLGVGEAGSRERALFVSRPADNMWTGETWGFQNSNNL
jgi:hypothetical protein